MIRMATLALFALTLVQSGCAPPRRRPPAPRTVASPIDTLALRGQTFFLAHDILAGRATGTLGDATAAIYLESECRRLGLEPVGGSYQHPVPLEEAIPVSEGTALVAMDQDGDSIVFGIPDDFVITGSPRAAGFSGRAVWVGTTEEITSLPANLPPLRGAVALTAGPVRQPAARILHEQGATGMVHLLADEDAYRFYAARHGRGLMAVADSTVVSSYFPSLPAVIAAPATSHALVATARAGRGVRISMAFERHAVRAANVGCLLPGYDPDRRDTAIVYAAHHDHLGYSLPDERGDPLYNGFSDNAAGAAMLLSIAAAIRARPERALRHSVLFLFFAGEERGLLGSDYFVAHPPFPLGRMRALINLDAGAPPARPWTWHLEVGEGSPLGTLGMDVAATRGWAAVTSAATPNSDHFPFHRNGVPAVLIIPGPGPYQGLSADSSAALFGRWNRYHQPADEWYDDFPFEGLQRYAEYALLIGLAVDGSEFAAGRNSRRRPPSRSR